MTTLPLNLFPHGTAGFDAIPTLVQDFTTWQQKLPLRTGGTPINSYFKLLSAPDFQWKSGYVWEHTAKGTALEWPPATIPYPAWTSDTDADVVPNMDMITKTGINPYSVTSEGLVITPVVTPPDVLATVDTMNLPAKYISGAIISYPFSQLYGVFAMVAKVPKGQGLWPAFWLLPHDTSWPPELDIMEILGKNTNQLWTTIHSAKIQNGVSYKTTNTVDLSADFHEYAVDWGPDTINWYLDRNLVYSAPTPKDLHKACYIIANLAIGKVGSWAGAPAMDANNKPILGSMVIKSIKVWQRPTYI